MSNSLTSIRRFPIPRRWRIGIVGHVGSTTEMYYAPDVLLDPYYQVIEPLTRSELDIPLKRHGTLIGGIPEETLVKQVDEDFLTSAAFRSVLQVRATLPNLRQRYFASHSNAKASIVSWYLRVGQALGILSLDEIAVSQETEDSGRIAVRIELTFEEHTTKSLFLAHGSEPRDPEEYEQIGRQAMVALVAPGGPDAFRLRPLQDDGLWRELRQIGYPNFQQFFGTVHAAVIASDYLTIEWWAHAMSRGSQIIAEFETCADPGLQTNLRNRLARLLDHVRKDKQARFGEPWGLIAMYLAAGRRPQASMEIIGRRFTLLRLQGAKVPEPVTA